MSMAFWTGCGHCSMRWSRRPEIRQSARMELQSSRVDFRTLARALGATEVKQNSRNAIVGELSDLSLITNTPGGINERQEVSCEEIGAHPGQNSQHGPARISLH